MAVIDGHRWKSMGTASVECECGEIIHGDGSLTRFPADEAFRRHLATAALEAASPCIRASAELAAGKAVVQREERIAGLEAALKRFEHLEESAVAAAVRRGTGQAVADERKRIAELSREVGASYAVDPEAGVSVLREFADLIEAER